MEDINYLLLVQDVAAASEMYSINYPVLRWETSRGVSVSWDEGLADPCPGSRH